MIKCVPWPSKIPSISMNLGPKWWSDDHSDVVKRLAYEREVTLILELGAGFGWSATSFSTYFPRADIVCVDSWEGDPYWSIKLDHDIPNFPTGTEVLAVPPELLQVVREGRMLEQFHRNMWNFRNYVHVISGKTSEILPTCKPLLVELNVNKASNGPDLIYIDASHDTQDVLFDLTTCYDLFPKAFICGDDFQLPSVQTALILWSQRTGKTYSRQGMIWWIDE